MKKENPAAGTKDTYQQILKMFTAPNEISEKNNSENTKPIDEVSKKWNMNDKVLSLFADNIQRDQELKEKYAIILIIILGIQLLALLVIFVLKGCNVLDYTDSTFNIFITGGIAEVFVLVRVIVKYLFKDNLTNALNIILKYNNQSKSFKPHKKDKNKEN